jgi:hypothetical protein
MRKHYPMYRETNLKKTIRKICSEARCQNRSAVNSLITKKKQKIKKNVKETRSISPEKNVESQKEIRPMSAEFFNVPQLTNQHEPTFVHSRIFEPDSVSKIIFQQQFQSYQHQHNHILNQNHQQQQQQHEHDYTYILD